MHAHVPATPQQLRTHLMRSAWPSTRLAFCITHSRSYKSCPTTQCCRLHHTGPLQAVATDGAVIDAPAEATAAPDGRRGLHSDAAASEGDQETAPALTGPYSQPHPEFVERLRGQLILAPLTKYGNLPFRRLCADFGANVTMGEMMYARELLNPKNRSEKARLRRAENEQCFGARACGSCNTTCGHQCSQQGDLLWDRKRPAGAQIATKTIDEGVRAGAMAKEAGATWLDLNAACPIYEATKRGCGARLLTK
jgi:tRNA-dihydrouridine synthase 3